MQPTSKYMTINDPRIVCFVVSAQLTEPNEQNLVKEASQRCFQADLSC